MTEQPTSLAAALALLQTRLPIVQKGETATVTSQKTGKTYSYHYADLADVSQAVLPLLGELGLSFVAMPTLTDDGKFVLAYELMHVSDQARSGRYPLPASGSPQDIGTAITYARRYTLCSVTGLAPAGEDDDAAAATRAHERDQRRTSRRQRPREDTPPEPTEPAETGPVAERTAEEIDAWLLDFTDRVANAPDVKTLRGPLYHEMVDKVTQGWITAAEGADLTAQMGAVAERLQKDTGAT